MRRYTLHPVERAKLQRLAHQELDAMAKTRSLKRARTEAREDADRQALRQALHRAKSALPCIC
jgi:hypothetical protein